jgi:hypothetical protein
VRQGLNSRALWIAGIVVAAVISIALIFATTGLAGIDFRPAGGGGGGPRALMSLAASHSS